jgi:hypothetical protein
MHLKFCQENLKGRVYFNDKGVKKVKLSLSQAVEAH